jgi:serine phosphatase RsbU (regulator of sigma subunit)/CHASE2 domain-containing sensor protein
MLRRRPRRKGLGAWHGAAIAFVCALLLYFLQSIGSFEQLDLKLYDLRYSLRGTRLALPSISIVEIDDRTVAAFGTSPLPRSTMALLLHVLEEAGVRAIGLDIQFIGHREAKADSLLAAVTAGRGNIVHAIAFFPADAENRAAGQIHSDPALETQGRSAPVIPAPIAGTVVVPFADLLAAAGSLGHITVEVDPDGVVRRVPLLIRFGERLYPALALRLAGAAVGDTTLPQFRPTTTGVEARWASGRAISFPIDHAGTTAIDFAGDRNAFSQVHSMLDVLRHYRAGDRAWLRSSFSGRVVLIGNTALGQATTDLGATPFSASTPLLYLHANALDSALRRRFLSSPPLPPYLIALGLASIVLGSFFVTLPLAGALTIMVIWWIVGAGVDWLLYTVRGIVMPPTMWILLPAVAYAAVESYRLVFLERRTREREKELKVARSIQRRLLPDAAPAWSEFDVHGINIPAREVGGDYYDWVPLGEDRLVVGLGDVSGKGVAAALLMSHLHASFHASIRETVELREAIRAMHVSLHQAIEPGRFATFFLAALARSSHRMRFCNAGHNPGMLLHDGDVHLLPATGLPLGAIEGAEYEEVEREFSPGDLLVLYSDGITECPSGKEFYGEERLIELLRRFGDPSITSAQIGEAILDNLRAFSAGNLDADDVTLLVARRL